MVRGWNGKREVRMFQRLEDVGRAARHLIDNRVIEPTRPVGAAIGIVPIDLAKIVNHVAAGNIITPCLRNEESRLPSSR